MKKTCGFKRSDMELVLFSCCSPQEAFLMPEVFGIKIDNEFSDLSLLSGDKKVRRFFFCFDDFVEALAADLNNLNGFVEE